MQQPRGVFDSPSLLVAQGVLIASSKGACRMLRKGSLPVHLRRALAMPAARRWGAAAIGRGAALSAFLLLTAPGSAAAAEGEGEEKGAGEHELKKPAGLSMLKVTLDGMLAGAAAGSAVEAALYPIDTIKTRLQVARSGGGINFSGLYSGVWGNLIGVIPASAIFVGVYEPLKAKLLELVPEDLSVTAHFTAGAAGGLAASLVRVPTEVIKQRMQTGQFPTAVSAVGTILKMEGVRGLYAGYGSFLLRDLPFDAIQFALYEQMKVALAKVFKRPLHDGEMAAVGAAAGALTGAITTPLDVIKTRLMTQGTSMRYKGIIDCIVKTSAEEGTAALFKGVAPRVMWIGIGGSIFFGVLEKAKSFLAADQKK